MGRGRTTTGMVAASLIATIAEMPNAAETITEHEDDEEQETGEMAEMQQYLNGESCQHFAICHTNSRRIQDHPAARDGLDLWQT